MERNLHRHPLKHKRKLFISNDRSTNDIKEPRHLTFLLACIVEASPQLKDKLTKAPREGSISADWIQIASIKKDTDFSNINWCAAAAERFSIPTETVSANFQKRINEFNNSRTSKKPQKPTVQRYN